MGRTNRSLMNAKPPTVKEGCNAVDTWHDYMRRISACGDVCYNMLVAHSLYTFEPRPSIRVNLGSLLNVIQNECVKAWRRHIRDRGHADSTGTSTTNLCSNCNDRFVLSSPTANLRSKAPDICLIYLDGASQPISPGPDHRAAQFVEPSPCCIVTAKTENSLQTKSTCPVFLTRHKPHAEEPRSKRFVGSVEQRPCRHGCLPFTISAQEEASSHQIRLLRTITATVARETTCPSEPCNVTKTCIFATEPIVKLLECSRVIEARNRVT